MAPELVFRLAQIGERGLRHDRIGSGMGVIGSIVKKRSRKAVSLRQHIIAALIHDLSGDRALAIERVRRDNRAFQRQQLQKFRNGGDLIGFAIDGELAQHKPLIGRPCADEMERRFLGGTVEGASQRLAVYGDNALDRLGEFPDEDKEAGVELDGIEQAEDAAEGVWLGMPCRKERNSRKNPPSRGRKAPRPSNLQLRTTTRKGRSVLEMALFLPLQACHLNVLSADDKRAGA